MFLIRDKERHISPNWRKMVSIIRRRTEFPVLIRKVIDECRGEDAEIFLAKVEHSVLNLLKYNQYYGIDETRGLNSDRDTESQVELAIRFFPSLLSRKRGYYPITWQLRSGSSNREFNAKAALFVPLLAKLTIELDEFGTGERGGLINGEWSVLLELATRNDYKTENQEHDKAVDKSCLAVIKRLRWMNLFRKEDIVTYDLITHICREPIFPEARFRYLVNWHPEALLKTTMCGFLPLHHSVDRTFLPTDTNNFQSMQCFQTVLEMGIQYFPFEMGGVFQKNDDENTPYQMACKQFGNEQVKSVINAAIDLNLREDETTDIEILIHVASKTEIHLDGVLFLLQRDPSILQNHRKKENVIPDLKHNWVEI